MKKARRLIELKHTHALRSGIQAALAATWIIEGEFGLWIYRIGCKEGHVPFDDEVVAETHGSYAVFKRDRGFEFLICQALQTTPPE